MIRPETQQEKSPFMPTTLRKTIVEKLWDAPVGRVEIKQATPYPCPEKESGPRDTWPSGERLIKPICSGDALRAELAA
jgi:hypothetical protein